MCEHNWVLYTPFHIGEPYVCCSKAGCGIRKDEYDKQSLTKSTDGPVVISWKNGIPGIYADMSDAYEIDSDQYPLTLPTGLYPLGDKK